MNTMPKVGSYVRLIGGRSKKAAKVEEYLGGVYDGCVLLDRKLDNFRYWNKDDLEPSPDGNKESK